MNLKIVTPEGVIYTSDDTIKLTVPTEAGVITILDDHSQIVTLLKAGELLIEKDDDTVVLAISTGVLHIGETNNVEILADTAERAEDIDLERALEAKKRAEELVAEKNNIDDIEFAAIRAKIEKELARISVARRRRTL